jgi:hypothetical protein
MPRRAKTALDPEVVIIGQARPKVRITVREEIGSKILSEGGVASIVVHDIPVEEVHKAVVEAVRQLASRRTRMGP